MEITSSFKTYFFLLTLYFLSSRISINVVVLGSVVFWFSIFCIWIRVGRGSSWAHNLRLTWPLIFSISRSENQLFFKMNFSWSACLWHVLNLADFILALCRTVFKLTVDNILIVFLRSFFFSFGVSQMNSYFGLCAREIRIANISRMLTGLPCWLLSWNLSIMTLRYVIWVPHSFIFVLIIFHRLYIVVIHYQSLDNYLCTCYVTLYSSKKEDPSLGHKKLYEK